MLPSVALRGAASLSVLTLKATALPKKRSMETKNIILHRKLYYTIH